MELTDTLGCRSTELYMFLRGLPHLKFNLPSPKQRGRSFYRENSVVYFFFVNFFGGNMKNEELIIKLHEKSKSISQEIAKKEVDLILILKDVIKYEVYRAYKYPNLFKYLTLSHGMPEWRAYEISTVTKAAMKFGKLEKALLCGKISVSKARRIAPVLDENNIDVWMKKARLNSHRDLEKLVAGLNPEVSLYESARYVSENQIELKLVISEKDYEDFKGLQDILCQKTQKVINLKGTLNHAVKETLKRVDPLQKAERAKKRLLNQPTETQIPGTCTKPIDRPKIPAEIFHQVIRRDRARCQESHPNGEKCGETRWIDFHHINPVHQGGLNTLKNLTILCKGHHQLEHWKR